MKTFDLGAVTAYALAVKNGFKGTEQDWLASLVPDLSIGDVKTLEPGSSAAATLDGTPENPVLNLSLPRGENGHAADWNQNDETQPDHVKNRTHYEDENGVVPLPAKFLPGGVPYIEGEMVEVLPECQPDYDSDNGNFLIFAPAKITIGEHYIVNWNGVEYPSTAIDIEGGVYLVNDGANVETMEGLVFFILLGDAELDAGSGIYGMAMATDGSTTTLTLSIYQDGTTINKLDNRCLDLAWLPTAGETEIVPETVAVTTEVTTGGMGNTVATKLEGITPADFTDGQKVVVYYDGVRYETTYALRDDIYAVIGDINQVATPFAVMFFSKTGTPNVATNDYDVEHTIRICTLEPNKMPAEFLPADATELYLTSSGGKKFKITVSDDGALSAAEVTA